MPRTGLTAPEIRARALEVALERIRTQGFEKVRLTDVAHDLGVSHAALYAHFANKEALLDAVLDGWLAETTAALDAVCAGNRKPLHKIEQWFVTQYKLKRERARTDRPVYEAFNSATSANKPFVCAYLDRRRDQLIGLIEATNGQLGKESASHQAAILLDGLASFLHPRLILDSADRDREAELTRVLSTLLRGLAAK